MLVEKAYMSDEGKCARTLADSTSSEAVSVMQIKIELENIVHNH